MGLYFFFFCLFGFCFGFQIKYRHAPTGWITYINQVSFPLHRSEEKMFCVGWLVVVVGGWWWWWGKEAYSKQPERWKQHAELTFFLATGEGGGRH